MQETKMRIRLANRGVAEEALRKEIRELKKLLAESAQQSQKSLDEVQAESELHELKVSFAADARRSFLALAIEPASSAAVEIKHVRFIYFYSSQLEYPFYTEFTLGVMSMDHFFLRLEMGTSSSESSPSSSFSSLSSV
jgi:hypothetical protein